MNLLSMLFPPQDHSAKVLGAASLGRFYTDTISKLRSDHDPAFHPGHIWIIHHEALIVQNLLKFTHVDVTLIPVTKHWSTRAVLDTCLFLEMSMFRAGQEIYKNIFFLALIADVRINM